jgi:hypothetical protein
MNSKFMNIWKIWLSRFAKDSGTWYSTPREINGTAVQGYCYSTANSQNCLNYINDMYSALENFTIHEVNTCFALPNVCRSLVRSVS